VRVLHAIRLHERFVASGQYDVWETGQTERLTEGWSIHAQDDGAHLTRIDQDGRAVDGRSRLFEIWRDPVGRIERFDLHAYGQAADAVRKVRARCTLEADHIHISQAVNDGPWLIQEHTVPATFGLDLGTLLSLGSLARAMISPWVTVGIQFDDPQQPIQVTQRTVHIHMGEAVEVSLVDKCYHAITYDIDGLVVVVDAAGIPLRAEWPARQAVLTQYARRPARGEDDV
jgi:hypothetical protein